MRIWNGRNNDNGRVHAIGNGKICAYEQGPDIMQVFGPPYGAGGVASLFLDGDVTCMSEREKGTAIWNHYVHSKGKKVATMTDFCGDGAQFYRVIDSIEPLSFSFDTYLDWLVIDNLREPEVSSSVLIKLPPGRTVFSDVVSVNEQYMQLVVFGDAKFLKENNTLYLKCNPGRCSLIFT